MVRALDLSFGLSAVAAVLTWSPLLSVLRPALRLYECSLLLWVI